MGVGFGREIFQSTPPVKAATQIIDGIITAIVISIHAAREGGDCVRCSRILAVPISIHAAREGGDIDAALQAVYGGISIHAAREGGDGVGAGI